MNIVKFLKTPILKNICERLLLYSNHKVTLTKDVKCSCFKYWASHFNQKYDVGWFLPRRFEDLLRVYSLLIISRDHSNMFLLLDLQKNYLISILMMCK